MANAIHYAGENDTIQTGDRVEVEGRGLGYVEGIGSGSYEGIISVQLDSKSAGDGGMFSMGGSRHDRVSVRRAWVRKVLPPVAMKATSAEDGAG